MKVLFDLRICQTQGKRGIGRYVLGLLEEIISKEKIDISILISNNLPYPAFSNGVENKINIYALENFNNYDIKEDFDFFFQGCFFLFESITQRQFDLIDTIYPPNVIKRCKQKVGIMYDSIPMIFCKYFLPLVEHKINYTLAFESLKWTEHFFTISNNTKYDAMKYLNRNEKDFTTIHGGVDYKKFTSKNSDKEYIAAERTNNLINISGDSDSKNYVNMAKSFAIAYESKKIPQDAKLYMICHCTENYKVKIAEAIKPYGLKLGKEVIVPGFIPDEEMLEILSTAKANIFPSYYEGLGLPVLEAYAAGTPSFGSNKASVKEFLLEECSFNPNDNNEIVDMIIKIYNNEELCRKSLEFGRNLVKSINWDNAALLVLNKLFELKQEYEKKNLPERIAVFCPGELAIAEYTVRKHSTMPQTYDIISDIQTLEQFNHLISLIKEPVKNLIPYANYQDSKYFSNHIAKIFVLGNSPHHMMSFNEAIKTAGEKNRYLYLHEPILAGPFLAMLNNDINKLKEFIVDWYPWLKNKVNEVEFTDVNAFMIDNNIFFIRPLLNLTKINKIIALNEKCKNLILKELTPLEASKINIDVSFLPIEKFEGIERINIQKNEKEYIIGCFGIASKFKSTEKVIQAVNILNKQNFNVKLILVGPNISDYLNFYPEEDKKHILIYNNPDNKTWLELMNSVDLALQLRPNANTDSSGCVSELIGLNKRFITTTSFVVDDFKAICDFVDSDITSEELAKAIKTNLENLHDNKINDDIFLKYSFKACAEKIKEFVNTKYHYNKELLFK